jgi:hypothetical protein
MEIKREWEKCGKWQMWKREVMEWVRKKGDKERKRDAGKE